VIVVDTQVIAYATLRGPHAELARAVSARDSDWAAPSLWRSEFLNVLAGEMRRGAIALEAAIGFVADAAALVSTEAASDAAAVLTLADASRCTAYDLEFVAVAQALGVRLVTNDRQILDGFPAIAVSLQSFAGRSA
jgi:predicted nucleic acid-binding protein